MFLNDVDLDNLTYDYNLNDIYIGVSDPTSSHKENDKIIKKLHNKVLELEREVKTLKTRILELEVTLNIVGEGQMSGRQVHDK